MGSSARAGAFVRPADEDAKVELATVKAELEEANARWRALLAATDDVILTLNREGRITTVNQVRDGSIEEALGRHYLDYVSDADKAHVEEVVTSVFRTGQPRTYMASSPRINDEGRYEVQVGPRLLGGKVVEVILLARDVTERSRYETSLQEARRTAESASRAKSAFVANMSHELRTPLNSIIGFADLLAQEHGGPLSARQRTYVDHLQVSGRHLLSLINDVLDLSKVEAGRMALVREPISLAHIADAVRGILQPLADKSQVSLSVELDATLPLLEADPTRLKQILYNLVSNAIKFTPAGGMITVGANVERGLVHLWVRDSGIGIAHEHLPRLFTEFEQLDQPNGTRPEGTGLGLALVRRLAELHGGSVSVTSEPGHGSTFTVSLPLAPGVTA